jgi:4-hydroxy-4-methyl-2-oxoglutarate aldolase
MIENPPLLTLRRNFPRPSAEQLAAFTGIQTGFVVDALGGRGALDYRIKPVGAERTFTGTALTCEPGAGDVLAVFGTLDVARPGDVVVTATDGFTATAVIGDLLIGMMKNCGIAAFVTDGLVRDTPGIRAVGLPCFATGVTPSSPAKTGPGSVGLPIVVGGVAVNPGDIVVGDEDGVVVVPHARIDATIMRLAAVTAAEAKLDAEVKAGLTRPIFLTELFDRNQVLEVDS